MSEVATQNTREVARPLHVLVPLIKEDLRAGKDATERAGLPYYKSAGKKMLEAKGQMAQGEFEPWIKRHFDISVQHARRYMEYARATSGRQNEGIPSHTSLNDFHRQTGSPAYRSVRTKQEWHEPVKENIDRARREADRLRDVEMTRRQERDAEHKLALRLIDIGFKVLANELHPDKGGSRDAMSRLNRVRDRLKMHA